MLIDIPTACNLISQGEVVAIPTETVYGLAAALTFPNAINKIFALKKRPSDNPLIIHIAEIKQCEFFGVQLSADLIALAQAFWPGPMTLILSIDPHHIDPQVRAHLPTAAFRIPAHPDALEVIKQCGPLVMPSANISGRPSSTLPLHIEEDFGLDFPVLNGAPCTKGVESTILMNHDGRWEILRLGALSPSDFSSVLGYSPSYKHTSDLMSAPICPGQKYRHYAPKAKLILLNEIPSDYEGAILGFQNKHYPTSSVLFELGSLANPEQVCINLYKLLREIDQKGINSIIVDMNFPMEGLWLTIRERIIKASG